MPRCVFKMSLFYLLWDENNAPPINISNTIYIQNMISLTATRLNVSLTPLEVIVILWLRSVCQKGKSFVSKFWSWRAGLQRINGWDCERTGAVCRSDWEAVWSLFIVTEPLPASTTETQHQQHSWGDNNKAVTISSNTHREMDFYCDIEEIINTCCAQWRKYQGEPSIYDERVNSLY